MPPELSIVIPSYCRADLLRACLNSVTRYAPDAVEVLVVDDASQDGIVGRVARTFPGVRVLRLPERRGFCAAANAGIGAAAGGVIELLNDDTEVSPGWAEAALAPFRDAAVGAVAPLVLRACPTRDGAGRSSVDRPAVIDSAGDRYYLGGIAGKRGQGERPGPDYLRPCRVFGASGSSAFYRREALERAGTFPESFGAYFEDVDLAFRLHRTGYQVVFEPGSRVFHHVSASYAKPRRRLLEQQSLNEERVFWRNIPGRWLAPACGRHAAVLAAKVWKRWQEGGLAPFVCGRLRMLGEIPALLRHRRSLPPLGPSVHPAVWRVEGRFWGTFSPSDPAHDASASMQQACP